MAPGPRPLRVGTYAEGQDLAQVVSLAGPRAQVESAPRAVIYTKLAVQAAAGQAPDIIQVSTQEFSLLQHDAWFLPLTPRARPLAGSLAEYFTAQGRAWALPAACLVQDKAYYNRKLFDAKHLPYPKPGITLQALALLARSLSQPPQGAEPRHYGLVLQDGPSWQAWAYDRAEAVDQPLAPTRCLLNAPPVIAALQQEAQLLKDKALANNSPDGLDMPGAKLFCLGQTALLLASIDVEPTLKAEPSLSYGQVSLGGTGQLNAQGSGWALSRDCKDVERALPLLQALAQAQAAAYPEPKGRSLNRLRYSPRHPRWPEAESTALQPRLRQVWAGELEAGKAMKDSVGEMEKLLK